MSISVQEITANIQKSPKNVQERVAAIQQPLGFNNNPGRSIITTGVSRRIWLTKMFNVLMTFSRKWT